MSSPRQPILLLATSNAGKRAELEALLPRHVRILLLDDVGLTPPEEVGTSFAANAELKALSAARHSGFLAVADDSGLEVDALDGAPGVRTARFAGEGASDAENRAALLAALRGVPVEQRTALFRCAIAVARPDEHLETTYGSCEGRIGVAERGINGFGYDSIFELADGRTMAELTPAEKHQISHRGQAMRAATVLLRQVLGLGQENRTPR